jgi:hypothetical protein
LRAPATARAVAQPEEKNDRGLARGTLIMANRACEVVRKIFNFAIE